MKHERCSDRHPCDSGLVITQHNTGTFSLSATCFFFFSFPLEVEVVVLHYECVHAWKGWSVAARSAKLQANL